MERLQTPLKTYATSANGDLRLLTTYESPPYPGGPFKLPVSQVDSTRIFDPLLALVPSKLNIPPGINLLRNIEEARKMGPFTGPFDFVRAVKTKGDWDYKKLSFEKYENFGNWHFGIVAAAAGWPRELALRGPGAYQKIEGTSKDAWGNPWDIGESSFGDDPKDQRWIMEGYDLYRRLNEAGFGLSDLLPYFESYVEPTTFQR